MSKDQEGMRYPSVDQLADKTTSKYKLVIGAAQRAKQIDLSKVIYLEHAINKKSIGIALEEIYADKVIIK